jgi:hypothetical protein
MAKFPSAPHLPSLRNYWELFPTALAYVRRQNGKRPDVQAIITKPRKNNIHCLTETHPEWVSFFDYYLYHRTVCGAKAKEQSRSLHSIPHCVLLSPITKLYGSTSLYERSACSEDEDEWERDKNADYSRDWRMEMYGSF